MRDVQNIMANGFFNRPFVARTQLLVDRWGPEQRFQQVSLMDLTRALTGAWWSRMIHNERLFKLTRVLSLKGLCFGCVLFPHTKGKLMKSLLPTLGSNP